MARAVCVSLELDEAPGEGGCIPVWPDNCKFAGGTTLPATTQGGRRDGVTFRYDGTNWLEIGRALGRGLKVRQEGRPSRSRSRTC